MRRGARTLKADRVAFLWKPGRRIRPNGCMRTLALLALAAAWLPDLDVVVPPGSPLEWNRELARPVPTGRVRIPIREKTPTPGSKRGPGSTQTAGKGDGQRDRPDLDYLILNAEDYFQFTTSDYGNHLRWPPPPVAKPSVTQDDVATGDGFVMTWNYPPAYPAELIWAGIAAALREKIHPTAISWAESAAYCLEVGEPVIVGLPGSDGKIQEYLQLNIEPLPAKFPPVPKPKDPKDLKGTLVFRLAAVELSGGFPHAMDPTFARRLLSLGNESWDSVLECTRSPHSLLARNATAVLATFDRPETGPELAKLFRESGDPVVRARALRGIGDRGERSALDAVIDESAAVNLPMRVMAIHTLGRLGDPKGEDAVLKAMRKNPAKPPGVDNLDTANVDILWTAIPALGRLRKGKEVLLALELAFARKDGGNDTTPHDDPNPTRLLHQMTKIALAMHGEERLVKELEARVGKLGLGAFVPATWYALVETLARSETGAGHVKVHVVNNPKIPKLVRVEALKALVHQQRMKPAEVKEIALRDGEAPQLRARALQILADLAPDEGRLACAGVLADFAKSVKPIDVGTAFLVTAAVQAGGPLDAFPVDALQKAAERAHLNRVYARREGRNDANLKDAKISIVPPLYEVLVTELGRTESPSAIPPLVAALKSRRFPQGRAEAAAALAGIGGPEAEEALVDALDDPDGWVRFNAWRGLHHLSGQDHFCDWIFGNDAHRRKATESYQAWFKKKRGK